MYITNPQVTLPHLLSLLDQFSWLSGLSLNPHKTALNVSFPHSIVQTLWEDYNFQWAPHPLSYLGIQLTPSSETLYKANYPPLFKKPKEDLRSWADYSLSWFGKINSVKMILLPRILYYFRTLPVTVPRGDLQGLQAEILHFI